MGLIDRIAYKLDRGERLTDADALDLFEHADLLELGRLAEAVNQRKNGLGAFFNVNRHINPTNICALSCKFCAFSRKPGDEGAYAYSIEEILQKAEQARQAGATEVHMVGGLHPRWKFSQYLEIISSVKKNFPDLHVKAFTAVELDWLAKKARIPVAEVLGQLREAGLDSIPGGGAEIFHPEVRDQICDTKVDAERWIDIHRTAHNMGIRSNCTMLYGHIESYFHRVDHMRRLRDLQDETGGFNVFIPLSFQPFDNEMGIDRYTLGTDDLRTIAVARLYLDNFQHIKAYWVMLGQDIAQLALTFGANDIDGTVAEEKISRMAGGRAGMVMSPTQISELIEKTGKYAVERDTLYRPVRKMGPAGESTEVPDCSGYVEDFVAGDAIAADDLYALARWQTPARQTCKTVSLSFGSNRRQFPSGDATDSAGFAEVWIHRIQDSETSDLAGLRQTWLTDLEALGAEANKELHLVHPEQLYGLNDDVLARMREMQCMHVLEDYPYIGHEDASGLRARLGIHAALHKGDLSTTVQLCIPENEQGIDWSTLSHYLGIVSDTQQLTAGFRALRLVASHSGKVSPYEYLKAVLLAARILPENMRLCTPLVRLPSFTPAKAGARAELATLTALKYAPLCVLCGAEDLGDLDPEIHDIPGILRELQLAGLDVLVRDQRFDRFQPKSRELAPALIY